jgi:sugar (pentulose or hexulose) kinase
VGVDIGTTVFKALALDETWRPIGLSQVPTTWRAAVDGPYATPDDFLNCLREVLRQLLADLPGHQVAAIGLAGLAESGCLMAPDRSITMPIIPWFDSRGGELLCELDWGGEFQRHTGLYLDAQASLAKLLWWQRAASISPGSVWLSLPEYLAYLLSGELACEPSLASRTGLFDIDAVDEWPFAAELAGIPNGLMPPVRRAGDRWGTITQQVAGSLELEPITGAAVTVAGHDHSVAAIGVGCTGPNDLFASTGTSDVLLRSVEHVPVEARENLAAQSLEAGCHALAGRQILITGVRAGLVMRRISKLLGITDDAARDALDARAAALDAAPADLSISGLDNHVDELVIRCRDEVSPEAVWLAAAQAGATETMHYLRSMEAAVGKHRRCIAAGGWTGSATVRRAKREILPHIEFSTLRHPGAMGAALLARYAAEQPPTSLPDYLSQVPSIDKELSHG